MGDTLGLDYIVEHPIQGEVTLRTRTPIPRDQLLDILESLLQSNRAVMLRDKNGRYFISGSGQLTKVKPDIANPADRGPGYSVIVAPLQYISAPAMAEILKPVADEAAFVRVDAVRNLLMLAGTRAQLDGWLEMIATFDVDLLKGMSVGIFPLDYSSVEDMQLALGELLGGEPNDEGGGAIGAMVRIVPVERLNSILVVTPRSHYIETVGTWIERLDREPDANFEQNLYVYPVQNSTATRLAELLSTLFSGETGGRAATGRAAGVAPGLTPETISGGGSRMSSGGAGTAGGLSASSDLPEVKKVGGETRNYAINDVRVVADEENNALLIYAKKSDYRKIEDAIQQLDVVATQVIIEASILEVTLTDDLQYGLEWTFKGGLGSDYDGFGQLASGTREIGPRQPGFSYTVTNGAGEISAVLNALAEESLVNVISTPSIMVLDNYTAAIHVGDQVPTEGRQTVTDGGTTSRSIEYRDTGVKLSVTPSVNAGGMVTMTVEQSVTDVGQIDLATGQRSFLERNISSRVAVRSAESVVLGGLIRENVSSTESGVPFLHKIPLIGGLFGTKGNEGLRTELLVIITPRVIFNEDDLREVSREMRSRVRELELIDAESRQQLLGNQPE
jgi:general secretion pathway protein D